MAECAATAGGPWCTPDEESENAEQQTTEIEMLQSIFEGQFVLLSNSEYLVKVAPRVDDKVVLLPLQSSSEDLGSHTNEVGHLPEVTLYVKYPPSYPSHSPPEGHISSRWIEPTIASMLLQKLRERFEPSCPVVYEWIMYLQDDMVKDYCMHSIKARDQKQIMPPSGSGSGSDSAAPNQLFVRSTSLINDIEEYDKFEKFREFQSGDHDCGVCFSRVRGVSMCEPCGQCGLLYCKDCLRDYCKSCIGQSKMIVLECPASTCHEVLPDTYLKKILPEDFFQRYVMMRDKVELDSLPGMVFCPRCKSRTLSDPDSKVAVCVNCSFPFCKLCRQTWHGPGDCPALDKVAMAEGAEDGTEGAKGSSEEDKKRRLEELQSMLWVMSSKSVRQCPRCRSSIQKSGGCNKMSCSSCGVYFCWLCGKTISGYDHFDMSEGGGGGTKKRCVLFRDVDYLPPTQEEDIAGVDTIEEIEMVMRTKCPRCGRVEVKSSDNNWIKCYRCSFQYCHLCGEPCFGLYHFSEYGCKKKSSMKEDLKLRKTLFGDSDSEEKNSVDEGEERGREEEAVEGGREG